MPLVIQAVESAERDVPGYLDVDLAKRTGKFVRLPEFDEIPYPVQMEPNLVIEYYSR
jgi:small subunit ribosomal protein S4